MRGQLVRDVLMIGLSIFIGWAAHTMYEQQHRELVCPPTAKESR